MHKLGRVLICAILLALAGGLFLKPSLARADNVVEGFYETSELKPGQVVKLATKPTATVQLVPANTSKQIFGVVVDASNAPITLERPNQQVFVATGGSYPVFVANDHGEIKKGDYISISRFDGIGAKADGNQPVILGHADAGFDGVNNVKRHNGKYAIGEIKVTISVAPNPLFKNTVAIPQPLQRVGNSVAGREVPPFKVYMGLLLFVVSVSLAIILLVVGVRTSMTAIGRNPLSRHSVLQGMFQVIGLSLTIFGLSIGGVYLLLRL